MGAKSRRIKKMTAKSTWFTSKPKSGQDKDPMPNTRPKKTSQRAKQPPESILFVPHTPNSELRKILQQVDDKVMNRMEFGKVKVVERLGLTLLKSLGNPAPWRSDHCGRPNCWPCRSKEGSCLKHNVVYQITCMTCKNLGHTRVYYGESHRSAWDRSEDHRNALRTEDETYAIVKHWKIEHKEAKPEFQFKVVKSYRSSLDRQISEAILIDNEPPQHLLNSKSEWGSNRIPRLIIDPECQRPETSQGQAEQQKHFVQNSQYSASQSDKSLKRDNTQLNLSEDDISIRPGKKINISIQDFFRPRTDSNINALSTRSEVNAHAIEASREVMNVIRAVEQEYCHRNVVLQNG